MDHTGSVKKGWFKQAQLKKVGSHRINQKNLIDTKVQIQKQYQIVQSKNIPITKAIRDGRSHRVN